MTKSTSNQSNLRDDVNILIELIRMNEQNTNKKLDTVTERLVEYVDGNKERFDEIKVMIKEMKLDINTIDESLREHAIKPVKELVDKHDIMLNAIKEENKLYVKNDICAKQEALIKEYFWGITKKLIVFNIMFVVLYFFILLNSSIQLDWSMLIKIMAFFKTFFY